jgi:glycosyltransferase involved in cell wall biosynthesis
LFVGVLERYKAVDVLLDAWPKVLIDVPDAQLTIVGDGGQREELHERVRDEGLGSSIRFLAPMPRSELRERLDESSCLVLQSRSEGLARIVLETMARGRPIVASRVGGIEEVLEDGENGRLVPSEDADALAAALIDVLSDPARAKRMGDESLRRALERDPLAEYTAGIERFAAWI